MIKLCVSKLCGDQVVCVCDDKWCVRKSCDDKLRVSKWCGDKLWVDKLCVSKSRDGGRAGGRAGERRKAEVHNQKQEPHTKMWGKIKIGSAVSHGLPFYSL